MRFENWPQLLTQFLDSKRDQPFEWGVNDCCLFAADWVHLATGQDPALAFRGVYETAQGAADVLKDFGGVHGAIAGLNPKHGIRPVAVGFAGRGDLVLYPGGMGETLGVIDDGGRSIAGPGKLGLVWTLRTRAIQAWRVA